jgi:endonuclease/exonuclease/phosphatase family metal-dependent hydrolase
MIAKPGRFLLPLLISFAAALIICGCSVTVENPFDPDSAEQGGRIGDYFFCHWNVENFFDDQHDKRNHKADKEYDDWFARDQTAFSLKLSKLTEALLQMNGGRGPDILAICEVECTRAAESLMDALNRKLESRLHYQHVLMKDLNAGRHIAPAIITRLPVLKEKTRLHGKMLRILEGHIIVEGRELTIFASHWTSRINKESEQGRDKYADTIYNAVAPLYRKDNMVDIIVCGDFNDTPQDESVVKHLHSSAELESAKLIRSEPVLYNLFAGKDPARGFGTHFYNGKWYIFDQILVSPGMLNNTGWVCDPASAHTFNTLYRPGDIQRRPWRFGSEKEHGARGYSDHFPVTVKLQVR